MALLKCSKIMERINVGWKLVKKRKLEKHRKWEEEGNERWMAKDEMEEKCEV